MNIENKRYQVFISSTFNDLIEERAEVTQAIMELNHMPYGMEAFPAANETQWEWIKKAIEQSDYYIVIIGGKYGSINEKTGLSYTEMEYRYAEEAGVPCIAFLVDSSIDLSSSKVEKDPSKIEKLNKFKHYIESNRLRKSYKNKEDLKAKVIVSFIQLMNQSPRSGWLRTDSLKNYTSNEEVIRLMKENEELREKIKNDRGALNTLHKQKLAKEDELFDVEYNWSYYENPFGITIKKDDSIKISWINLFKILGGSMLIHNNINLHNGNDPISKYINNTNSCEYIKNIKRFDPMGDSLDFEIKEECLTQILIQFKAFGYLNNINNKWSLTDEGINYLTHSMVIKSND